MSTAMDGHRAAEIMGHGSEFLQNRIDRTPQGNNALYKRQVLLSLNEKHKKVSSMDDATNRR